LEAIERLPILGNVVGQEFQRDKAVEGQVFGLIDNTHPTAAEPFDNPVVRDGFANHEL
jgi:hypothetical protein